MEAKRTVLFSNKVNFSVNFENLALLEELIYGFDLTFSKIVQSSFKNGFFFILKSVFTDLL